MALPSLLEADATYEATDARNLVTIATALKDAIHNLSGEANDPLVAIYTLTWNWAFDDTDNTYSDDGADTILGNLIAGVANVVAMNASSKYQNITVTDNVAKVGDVKVANLDITFGLKVTVDQVN